MDSNPNASAAQRYGIPQSDPGSAFALNKYQGPTKVRPYSKETSSTRGSATAWDNPVPGQGSFMKWDDGGSGPNLPQPAGA